ncbi:MAG: hypothetical protein IIU00_00080 [Clostridia bacterium]|nr:hypothetical protein [Clostridia bacterium]
MQQFESFAQMQRDAERRVMEMQKRAMAAVETSDPPPIIFPNAPASAPDDDDGDLSFPEPSAPSEPPDSTPPAETDREDAERALLLATLFLVKDHADPRLLFLLLYLLT